MSCQHFDFRICCCGLVSSLKSASPTCPQKNPWLMTLSKIPTRTGPQPLFPQKKSVWMSLCLDDID